MRGVIWNWVYMYVWVYVVSILMPLCVIGIKYASCKVIRVLESHGMYSWIGGRIWTLVVLNYCVLMLEAYVGH